MLRSKDIKDYFSAPIEAISPNTILTLDVHIYFQNNNHIVLWQRVGEPITEEKYLKYNARGLKQVWIHNDDKDKFHRYQNRNPEPRTEEGALISEVLNSQAIPEEDKEAIASEAGSRGVKNSLNAETKEEQKKADEHAQDVVADVLAHANDEAHQLLEDIWKVAENDPDLEHSINVASYAVLFGMAFGRIDQELLADLAIAGLMHDVGISQVSSEITQSLGLR